MRHYWFISGAMILVFLALFGVVEALGVPLLSDLRPWLGQTGGLAAAVGVGLLIVDVLLPVPSSLVMVGHGALFGVVGGSLLSLVGSVGAAAVGFALGRRGGPLLDRLVPPDERARGDLLLARWGGAAIVATRPVPLIAETLAILAGTSPMRWRTLLVSATAGSIVPAVLYAVTGATAASLDEAWLVFGLVLLISGAFWFAAKRATP